MTGIDSDELAAAIQLLASVIAAAVVRELRAPGDDSWISQTDSPLGARRHNAAVRRRLASGEGGACIVGRSHKLSRRALDEELAGRPTQKRQNKPSGAGKLESFEERMTRRLRAVGADV